MAKRKRSKKQFARTYQTDTVDMDIDTFLAGGFETVADHTIRSPSPQDLQDLSKRTMGSTGASKRRSFEKHHAPIQLPQAAKAPKASHPTSEVCGAVQQDLSSHKAQLDALKIADPAFYRYLMDSDQTLLEFSDDNDSDSTSEDLQLSTQDCHVDDGLSAVASNVQGCSPNNVPSGYASTAIVDRACAGAKGDASLGAVRTVLSLYRAACHHGDPATTEVEDGAQLRIASDTAFQRILVFTLSEADTFFRRLLSLCTTAQGAVPAATFKSSKWRKVGPLVKSYLGNTLHLLAHLAEENSSLFILRRLRASAAFLTPFETLRKKMLKLMAGLFGSSDSHRVRLQALLWLREVGLTCGVEALSTVLRISYRTFAAHAHFVSTASLPHIAFMVSGLVELYGINLDISYEVMFGFVAQLAGLLRDALTMRTVDSYREVYSWRAINCLELWGRVVSAHAVHGGLAHLVYPVVQLLLAAARLVPSPRWFPVRLRLSRILNAVAAATGVFVPVAPLLLEILAWPGFTQRVSGSGKCPDLLRQLRLSKANLRLASVQQELVEQAMELLASSLALSARSPGFPELSYLPTIALRRFAKITQAERFRSQATLLLHAIQENAIFVGLRRDSIDFAPKDSAAASSFLQTEPDSNIPLLAYAKRLAEKGAQKRLQTQNDTSEPIIEDDVSDADIGLDDGMQLLPQLQVGMVDSDRVVNVDPIIDSSVQLQEDQAVVQDDVIQDYVVSDDEDQKVTQTQSGRQAPTPTINVRKKKSTPLHTKPKEVKGKKEHKIPGQATGVRKKHNSRARRDSRMGPRSKHGR
eukprot:jgi/Ulvmu1/5132/UM021_0149.1